jgi:hypothetical protein
VKQLATLTLVLLAAAPVAAQESWNPYSTTVYREGPGVKLGDSPLVFHPGLAVEGGYDSNVFYSASDVPAIGSGLLRFRAHFDIATLSPQRMEQDTGTADPKVEFRFSTQLEYREYLSDNPDVTAQRSVNLFANADLAILPRGPFTLRLYDMYVRTVDPRNEEGPTNFTRDFNRGGFVASLKPGTGRLELGIGDFAEVNFWESSGLAFGNNYYNEAQAFARFRLLTQTLLGLVVKAGYRNYWNNAELEAAPVRALATASSPILSWLAASAAIGYGNSITLAAGRESFNNVIANAEVRFILPYGARIAAGYDRDFFDSLLANFYVDDKIYVGFEQPFAHRVMAHLDGALRFRHYASLVDPTVFGAYSGYSSPTRDDRVWDVHAELNIKATSWMAVGVSYNFVYDQTDFQFLLPNGGSERVDYLKHAAFARIDLAY